MMGMERGFSMNNDMDQIILVDLSDNEISSANKMDAHFQCLLHRAFSIFIVNNGKMLVQKRNKNKYHSGGLITNACCSHPRKGELLEEAIHRRLLEEMGMDCPLEEISSFVYRNVFENGITEYEFDHVFIGMYDGDFNADPEEAECAEWVNIEELSKDVLDNPQKYTVWFISALPKVLEFLRRTSEKND